jgi:hypothetical protein
MGIDSSREEARAGRKQPGAWQRIHGILVSTKLAIALLVVVLACCIAGVTIWRYDEARRVIFSTLWFNALLVLLALSSATAFFSRVWRRKLTLLSVGMIVFHLSFAALLGGVVYNSLFRFRGLLRLTEGESLPNNAATSYDVVERGRFFSFDRLRGETTLNKVHRSYQVNGQDKRSAYEIVVGEGDRKVTDTIYIARGLEHGELRYICWHEGYTVLLVLSDSGGNELYGGYLPLQSLRQADGKYLYASGRASGAAAFLFPPAPDEPVAELLVTYRPSTIAEREGEVAFEARPLGPDRSPGPVRKGKVIVGAEWDAGPFRLSPREIRYWVAMDVRHDPGVNVILGSLSFGLGGMVLIFVARIRQGAARKRSPTLPDGARAVVGREEVA